MFESYDASSTCCMTRDQILTSTSLSLFQKILLITDGSVTDLLSIYLQETIRVQKLAQRFTRGCGPILLNGNSDTHLLHREVMLVGRARPYLHAVSDLVLDRLSPRLQEMLLETDVPIGALWKEDRAEMHRQVVDLRVERDANLTRLFGVPPDTLLLSRTYVIRQGGELAGMISERFPATNFTD